MPSPWPYHFVSPSEEEKLRRRELLDLRGSFAQWSVIVVIVALRLYQSWATTQISGASASNPRRGPSSWWDRPLVAGWIETRRQYLVCGLWLLWLLSLSVWSSGEGMDCPRCVSDARTMGVKGLQYTYMDIADYLHLTKALGHVALSQVPLQVLMSPAAYISTSNPSASSIFSFLTSIPQASVTPYHRLFGRMVISPLLFGHATLYLLFFVQSSHPEFGSLIFKRVRDFDVQCGLLALSTTILLLIFVRPRGVARKGGAQAQAGTGSLQDRRRTFYIGHVFLVVVLGVAAYSHVAHAQKYMIQALGVFVVNAVCSAVIVRWGGRTR